MKSFTQRMKEPSTWAGIAVLGAMFGLDPHLLAAVGQVASAIVPFVPVDGGTIAQTVIGASALAAVALPEARHGTTVPPEQDQVQ